MVCVGESLMGHENERQSLDLGIGTFKAWVEQEVSRRSIQKKIGKPGAGAREATATAKHGVRTVAIVGHIH